MAIFTPGGGTTTSSGGTSTTISTPTLANETATLANTEYSYSLPVGTKFFKLKSRTVSDIKLAYTATESGTNYTSICYGFEYESPPFEIDTSITIYFQATVANTVIEIESWA